MNDFGVNVLMGKDKFHNPTIDELLNAINNLPPPPKKLPCFIMCDNGEVFDIRLNKRLVSLLDGILHPKPFGMYGEPIISGETK